MNNILNNTAEEFLYLSKLEKEIKNKTTLTEDDRENLEIIANLMQELNEKLTSYNNQGNQQENVEKAMPYLKSELKPGYILCKCNLVDCIYMTEEFIQKIKTETNESDYGRYEVGRYAWKLELVEVLKEPIPAKGKLGIWNYEAEK